MCHIGLSSAFDIVPWIPNPFCPFMRVIKKERQKESLDFTVIPLEVRVEKKRARKQAALSIVSLSSFSGPDMAL